MAERGSEGEPARDIKGWGTTKVYNAGSPPPLASQCQPEPGGPQQQRNKSKHNSALGGSEDQTSVGTCDTMLRRKLGVANPLSTRVGAGGSAAVLPRKRQARIGTQWRAEEPQHLVKLKEPCKGEPPKRSCYISRLAMITGRLIHPTDKHHLAPAISLRRSP